MGISLFQAVAPSNAVAIFEIATAAVRPPSCGICGFMTKPAVEHSRRQRRTVAMQIVETEIADVKLIKPLRHVDSRGFLSEVFKEQVLQEHGIDVHFVQDNHSLSKNKDVVRGLHFQIPPFAQAKLVRVIAGSIFDVAVDIRSGSPSFGRHVAVVLSASEGDQIFIPAGFAHGYCTIEPESEVVYKVSAYYSAEHDRGILWNDPALGIAWPLSANEALISDRDRNNPLLSDLPRFFHFHQGDSARRF
jgi:dTDP-4-dehydrorhamnose 3,5-epimerase